MEIRVSIIINSDDKIVLTTDQGFEYIFDNMTINANDIYEMFAYQKDNIYIMNPFEIRQEEKPNQFKSGKLIYDFISKIVERVNNLNLSDAKTEPITLEDEGL